MRSVRVVVLIAILGLGLVWLLRSGGGPNIEAGSTLVLQLDGAYVENTSAPLLSRVFTEAPTPFASLLSELKKVELDDRLGAVVLRIRSLGIGWAQAQELREAIGRVSAAGRRTIAYLEVPTLSANREYYVASAAEEVHVSPAHGGAVLGLAGEYLFLGGLWDQLGIDFEVERIGRYKSAAETLAGDEMSDAYREVANAILDSVNGQFVAGIAESRGLTEAFVRRAIDAAPASAEELIALQLADGTGFIDEVIAAVGGSPVKGEDYARVDPAALGFDPVARFALVYGSGNVVVGSGGGSPGGGSVLASDTVSDALEEAAKDPDIDAIIFRIDSPGGSPLASDVVWRASQLARREGKPLIASMSNVAASGGYYVACGADAIVAAPASITGSIGVVLLRPVIEELLDKLDIEVETLSRGTHADLLHVSRPLSEGSRQRLRDQVRAIYDLFLARVAEGRGLTTERVDEIAQGRVWTGEQASEIGLVDRLGGLRDAVAVAKESLGFDPEDDVALVPYPQTRSLAAQLSDVFRRISATALTPLSLPGSLEVVKSWLAGAPTGSPTLMPPFAIDIR